MKVISQFFVEIFICMIFALGIAAASGNVVGNAVGPFDRHLEARHFRRQAFVLVRQGRRCFLPRWLLVLRHFAMLFYPNRGNSGIEYLCEANGNS
jgi:hypothetical protein